MSGASLRARIFQKSNSIYECLGSRAVPMTEWLSKVINCEKSLVDEAVIEIEENEKETERQICENLKTSGRTYYAQFPAPIELYALVRLLKPEVVVESGVSSGISSAHILMGIRRNKKGKLHSIDLPSKQDTMKRKKGTASWALPYGKPSGWAVPKNLTRSWDLLLGSSESILPDLVKKLGYVDLFCHDSPVSPEHLAFEVETITVALKPGSILIADNAGMNLAAVKKTAEKLETRIYHRGHSNLIAFKVPDKH